MGMSTNIVGFRAPDAEWERMYRVWKVCQDSDVELPPEVSNFFDYEDPDPNGIEVDLTRGEDALAKEWSADMQEGYEICIKDLPDNITHIRFFNGW